MKPLMTIVISSLLLMTTACSVSKSNNDPVPDSNKPQGGSNYAARAASGKVFGQNWEAKSASVEPSSSDPDRLILRLRPDVPAKICGAAFPNTPYIEVNIPADYAVGDYTASVTSGFPVLFQQPGPNPTVLVADDAQYRINAIDAGGFDLSIYAIGRAEDGVSEVNGQVKVTDCRKVVDFSVWDEFVGWFSLVEFNGQSINQTVTITRSTRNFYDRATSRWVTSIDFPLIFSASGNSTGSYEFGPLDGLGQTSLTTTNGNKTITYSYHGPIHSNGIDIQLNLDMTLKQEGSVWLITYTLEVPKHINKTTHSFKIRK